MSQSDIVEIVQTSASGGTKLGPDSATAAAKSRSAKKNAKKQAKKAEEFLNQLEDLDQSDDDSEFDDDDSDSDDESGSDDSESDSEDDEHGSIDLNGELDESDIDAQKVKVQAAELGHKFLHLQIERSEMKTIIDPLISCCASGNIDLLDEILEEGLFCPKSNLLLLLNVCAAFPIQDIALRMYDAIKDGAAACSGDPDAGYGPCKYCEPKKKSKSGSRKKKSSKE